MYSCLFPKRPAGRPRYLVGAGFLSIGQAEGNTRSLASPRQIARAKARTPHSAICGTAGRLWPPAQMQNNSIADTRNHLCRVAMARPPLAGLRPGGRNGRPWTSQWPGEPSQWGVPWVARMSNLSSYLTLGLRSSATLFIQFTRDKMFCQVHLYYHTIYAETCQDPLALEQIVICSLPNLTGHLSSSDKDEKNACPATTEGDRRTRLLPQCAGETCPCGFLWKANIWGKYETDDCLHKRIESARVSLPGRRGGVQQSGNLSPHR